MITLENGMTWMIPTIGSSTSMSKRNLVSRLASSASERLGYCHSMTNAIAAPKSSNEDNSDERDLENDPTDDPETSDQEDPEDDHWDDYDWIDREDFYER